MAAPDLKTLDIGDGRRISYREAGGGTPVVILHGLGGRSESWAPHYDGLSDRYRVIGWDAPGYNDSSEMPDDEPLIPDYVKVIKRFTDALGLDRFHLVGHSVGTVLAAGFHQSYPEQLISLTLAEAVIGSGGQPRDKQDAAIAARRKDFETLGVAEVARTRTPNSLSPSADPAVIEKAVQFAAQAKVPGQLKLAAALIRVTIFDHVAPLACPGLIVAGSDDRSAPPEFVKQIADAYPGIKHHTIDGIGHQIAFEKPKKFVGLLRDHLDAAESSALAAE
ncbi:MAG: alpha/beta hydrolase [Proteobacteria bacterium]|nr:alpha/beta hydrolase [Pseudomonadota bacterium]